MSSRNLIVAFGGVSPEHEVSVLTAMQVIESLKGTNYNIIPLYISKSGRWLTGDSLLKMENYQNLNELKEQAIHCTFSHDDLGKPVLLETEKKGFLILPGNILIIPSFRPFKGSREKIVLFKESSEFNIFRLEGVVFSPQGWEWNK